MAGATFVRRILISIFVLGLAIAQAQTITKISGDGQLVIQSIQSSNPMIVLIRDASGNPISECEGQVDGQQRAGNRPDPQPAEQPVSPGCYRYKWPVVRFIHRHRAQSPAVLRPKHGHGQL